MTNSYSFLFLLIPIVILIYFNHRKKLRLKREKEQSILKQDDEARLIHFNFFKAKIDYIQVADKQFSKLLEIKNGYFSNYQLQLWQTDFAELFAEINDKPYENIQLDDAGVTLVRRFKNHYQNAEKLRIEFNSKFLKEELKNYRSFFDDIEGRKLDIQQRTSIISNEDNSIVIAGAGTGKTTTIIGKVKYTLERYQIDPSEILLISFTKKSAETLAQRINIKGIEAKTFHKFGLDVICEVEKTKSSIFDEKRFKPFVINTFEELLKSADYIQKVTQYFTDFLKPYKSKEEFKNQGEYFQYLKDQNFKAYKQKEVSVGGKRTFKREIVKSIEECKIANFLLFNSIDYSYELPYEHDTATQLFRQYKPDFTINPSGSKIYLEHFGINKYGNVPDFFVNAEDGETLAEATKKYNDGIIWKRNEHQKNSTILLETYSYEMINGVLFNNLTEKLSDAGITLIPKTPEEIWDIISKVAEDEIDNIITLFQTFITLMKSNNYNISDVIKKNSNEKDDFIRKRNELFIEIIEPIYNKYENHLTDVRKEIDFNDMISKASNYLANGQYKKKFSYIIIDEFQDISIGRYQLIKAINLNNPACKLFCVGDDWQSIYRFTGSDISLFKEFEKYFGVTVKSKIETTYRFQSPLIKLSSEFILKNPNQEKKNLKGTGFFKSTDYSINYSSEDQDDSLALKHIFDNLITDEKIKEKKIFILGRYSFDIKRIKNTHSFFVIDEQKNNININYLSKIEDVQIEISAQYLTVHKAKGLEADIVIVINCNSGKHGFPAEMSDDLVLNLLLSKADQFENGEERRLFYVAMTRAKEKLFFLTNNSYKSKFISELEIVDSGSPNKKCPQCKTADLKLKSGITKGKVWNFYGCTNLIYGCKYQEWVN